MSMNHKKRLCGTLSALVPTVLGMSTASASEVGDTPEIGALRARYIEAVLTNNPQALGGLVTDDFVMLQPNEKGPDTYGRNAYVNYRKSLKPILKLAVEPARVISCGSDWAFEIGKERLEWKLPGMDYPAGARVVKVLNRAAGQPWRYARMVVAWDRESQLAPPAPGYIINAGFGTWEPRKQTGRDADLAKEMMGTMTWQTRQLVATGDMVNLMPGFLAGDDPSIGPLIGYGASWELHGVDEYMKNRTHAAMTPYDDLRKIYEEGYVCEPDTGFLWGQDMVTGTDLATGKRWIHSGDFFYMMKKQAGAWKIGPVGILYGETGDD